MPKEYRSGEYRPDVVRRAAHTILDAVSVGFTDDDDTARRLALQRLAEIDAVRMDEDGNLEAGALILATTYLVRLTLEGCVEDPLVREAVLLSIRGTIDTAIPDTLDGPPVAT